MGIEKMQVDNLMFIALILGTPFFLFFGWLSDKVGRKWIMMAGMLIAIVAYRPIYEKMYQTTNVAHKKETGVVGTAIAKPSKNGTDSIYTFKKQYSDGTVLTEITTVSYTANVKKDTGVKTTVSINNSDKWTLIWLVFIQVIFVTMVYGPIAAFLVELFPTRIRYTSMSLPYHIGNGVFGGLLPAVATYLANNAQKTGNPQWYLQGLWYPIAVAGVCLVIGVIYINGKDKQVDD
jgi:MFS family permease